MSQLTQDGAPLYSAQKHEVRNESPDVYSVVSRDAGRACYQRKQDTVSNTAAYLHCKKRFAIFPSPAGMSLTKLSLGGNIPAQGEFSQ